MVGALLFYADFPASLGRWRIDGAGCIYAFAGEQAGCLAKKTRSSLLPS